ncbi:DUF1289 domain-containing protein [Agaribacterium sp. ZY112]|uniref:DUF1289 domain-containing protein n=1 Tax=Agaribacterium sp. ZY112 TaxID=3233574 RepID=UPI0035237BBF
MEKQASKDPASPCVRNCALNNEDICQGCYRTLEEISLWSKANFEYKEETLLKCYHRKKAYTRQ